MHGFTYDNDLIILCLIGITISLMMLAVWLRYRYQSKQLAIEEKHIGEVNLFRQTIQHLQQSNLEQQKELEQLDMARDKSEFDARQAYGELMASKEKLNYLELQQVEMQQLKQANQQIQQQLSDYKTANRELEVRHTESQKAAQEKLQILEQAEKRLKVEFESLANQVFEAKVKSVDEQNKLSLDGLLSPLKEQLHGFKQQVDTSFNHEAKERHTLVHEIRHLQKLNQQMAQDAVNLTQALKGDNKQQGNWGEVVLANVLKDSGLREGHEYQTQVSLNHENGKRYQPDVIVNLPENKQVVIDSKMTLVAFERYFNGVTDADKSKAITEHLIAMRSHIKLLSQKDYHQLQGITSLDYVLMFIPIEPAFQLAMEADPRLVKDAMEQNIILVSPTTLLVALRTINHLWRNERQNQNAKLIADKASKLYDKMRLFVDDMDSVGSALNRAQSSYQGAMNKLSQGKGNLIRQAEGFKSLGVEVKKEIAPNLAEIAQNDFHNDRQSLEDKVN
ncbi:DNA recombination protein RmuC [Vibrio sp. S17_S38]|uniref:DNA recombination protein RmuC n=1 Tax=Vibrio sp. S17_S38 TaxID=2720229 RepID=UPI0016800AED|nr:DNA recombination protein RmuC [Vibrio sp. S17_S38]